MKEVVWSYGKEGVGISAVMAACGTFLNWWLGGFDVIMQALLFFMIFDFAVGFAAAAKNKCIDSHVMLWGGVNKVLVIGLVGVGVMLDRLFGTQEPYIRTAIIWFYIGRELLSLVENYGKMGLPLAPVIKTALQQIKGKGEIKE